MTEHPRCPRTSLSGRRARSLDRSQNPRKDSESCDCHCLSLLTPPSRRALQGTASDGTRCPKSPAQSAEAQGTTAAALSLEGPREFLPSERRPPPDTKKDKAQRRAQQGWLKTVLNFVLRVGPEEPEEKGSRRAKGKEGFPQPAETPESPGQPASRKKAHDKKDTCRKHSHKKQCADKSQRAQDQEAEGQGAGLLRMAAASLSVQAHLGPAPSGGEDSALQQSLLTEGGGVGVLEGSSQAPGDQWEGELKNLDEDTILQMIVGLLQKVGDQWEEELQALLPQGLKLAPQNPAPAYRKKSQDKKSSLKRTFSYKKHSSEEPKRAGATDVSSPKSRPPKRPSFLPLCVGGHRPSISSSPGAEEPEVQEALSTDGGGPSPSELSSQAGSRGQEEDLQLDRASEFKEFIETIITLLQDAEEQEGDKQFQVQEPEVAVENLAPAYRKKSHEKKPSFRKAFSLKKYGSKEPKRAGAADATSPEARPLKKPNFRPLCVGGHRSSISPPDLDSPEFQGSLPAEGELAGSSEAPSQARSHKPEGRPQAGGACESKEPIIQRLVALLQEVDGQVGEQIRRHPSFKRFFYKLSDSSLRKLAATLCSPEAHSTEPHRSSAERRYQFAFELANKFAGSNRHAVLSLMGRRYSRRSYSQFPYGEAQPNITSHNSQSPD
nr:protein BNIP5 isoform X1 [Manis javanica]XP_036871458.1 protein BNIP5 isoform X1 [Manis javanica]